MKREFLTTADGSVTIHLLDWNEQYHSKHGAIAEARHVFLKEGLHYWQAQHALDSLSIMEIGFGTGLNALLTALEAIRLNLTISYTGVEAYPVSEAEVLQLNYTQLISDSEPLFAQLHQTAWEKTTAIHEGFSLTKRQQFFADINDQAQYDLIYFDAFGARVQPELWTEAIFQRMHDALKLGGVLTTYAAKGSVRRAMQAVGFEVERLPGPPGKREMLRASKV